MYFSKVKNQFQLRPSRVVLPSKDKVMIQWDSKSGKLSRAETFVQRVRDNLQKTP